MRSLFPDIKRTVENTRERTRFTLSTILKKLGIQRSWYYRQINPGLILDQRFNTFSITDEEWIVIDYKQRYPR
ncbi:hypothetical protein B1B_01452, partial [mine drainage metagenome]